MKKEVIIDLRKVNIIYAVLQIGLTLLLFYIKINMQYFIYYKFRWYMILYIIFIVFFHEGLHGVGFRYIGKASWKNINYGVYKYLTPYCTCEDLIMSKRQYIGIMLLPNIVLSGLTLVIMFKSCNLFWTLIVAFVISSGIGDYYMVAEVSKYTAGVRVQDHPMEPGFYVYE